MAEATNLAGHALILLQSLEEIIVSAGSVGGCAFLFWLPSPQLADKLLVLSQSSGSGMWNRCLLPSLDPSLGASTKL